MARRVAKAPYLAMMENSRVRDAFALLTAHKEDYIVYENGKPVDYREAVRRYKETGDDVWVMHVLASNLGYFANALSKVAARYNIAPEDYVVLVYEGLRRSMEKCDASRVRLSYLSTGVFLLCRREAEHEIQARAKEAAMSDLGVSVSDDDNDEGMDLDTWLARNGVYEVPLYDEGTCEAPDEQSQD
jgi:sulfur carrier protein ThiS